MKKFSAFETYWWTATALKLLRSAIDELGFHEIVPTPFSARYEAGARHSIVVLGNRTIPQIKINPSEMHESKIGVYGEQYYYVAVSHSIEKQVAAEQLGRVYCLSPSLRLLMNQEEKSKKHLYSFIQFDVELKTQSMENVFEVGEKLLVNFANKILDIINSPINNINVSIKARKNLASLLRGHYPKITFAEAAEKINREKNSKGEFTSEQDAAISNQFDSPFWIYNYPDGIREDSDYYHENPKGIFQSFDLMLPFEYGELATGGIRPTTGSEIRELSKASYESYHPFYADWKDRTKSQSAGFGMGLERLLRFISGAESILDFVQPHDDGPNRTIFFK